MYSEMMKIHLKTKVLNLESMSFLVFSQWRFCNYKVILGELWYLAK